MKIFLITFGEPLPIDGKNVRFRRNGVLANYAIKRGHTVDWFAPSFNHISKSHRQVSKSPFEENGITYHIIKSYSYKKNLSIKRFLFYIDSLKKILKQIKKEKKTPDIIFIPLEYCPYSRSLIRYCKKRKITLIPDLTDLWDMVYDVAPNYLKPILFLYKLYMKSGHSFALNNTKGFVSFSEPAREWAAQYLKRPIDDVCDFVFPLTFSKSDIYFEILKEENTSIKVNANNFNIVYAGGLNRFVEFGDIVEAAKLLKDISDIVFVICGGGTFYDAYRRCAPSNMMFLGQVDYSTLDFIYKKSNLSIIPYNSNAFFRHAPYKFAEYLAYSLPILVRPDGYMRNIIETNNIGCYYTNGEELAKIIKGLYDSPTRINEMRNNSQMLYSKKYISERQLDELFKYYTNMIQKNF